MSQRNIREKEERKVSEISEEKKRERDRVLKRTRKWSEIKQVVK